MTVPCWGRGRALSYKNQRHAAKVHKTLGKSRPTGFPAAQTPNRPSRLPAHPTLRAASIKTPLNQSPRISWPTPGSRTHTLAPAPPRACWTEGSVSRPQDPPVTTLRVNVCQAPTLRGTTPTAGPQGAPCHLLLCSAQPGPVPAMWGRGGLEEERAQETPEEQVLPRPQLPGQMSCKPQQRTGGKLRL